jgi:hypothetical protein
LRRSFANRLSKSEADCFGLELKLRFDAPHDLAWTIVSPLARPIASGGFERVYVTDQRLGLQPQRLDRSHVPSWPDRIGVAIDV